MKTLTFIAACEICGAGIYQQGENRRQIVRFCSKACRRRRHKVTR